MTAPNQRVTQALVEFQGGNRKALDELFPILYEELHRLAKIHMRRELIGHTLQPTALVHETYLRLVEQRVATWSNRAHFLGVASHIMRRILVDHARKRYRVKRGGLTTRIALDENISADDPSTFDLIVLDDALSHLAVFDPQQSRIVELRFFGGLTVEETAEVLGISAPTVKRDWAMARAWLNRKIERGVAHDA